MTAGISRARNPKRNTRILFRGFFLLNLQKQSLKVGERASRHRRGRLTKSFALAASPTFNVLEIAENNYEEGRQREVQKCVPLLSLP